MSEVAVLDRISIDDLRETWPILSKEERVEGFLQLDRDEAEEFFWELSPRGQSILITGLPGGQGRFWMRQLAPDDAADVLQEIPTADRPELLVLLDEATRAEVTALLAYAEDDAGGLMSPRFARVRPEMTVDEAIRYLRRQAREHLETIYYAYVLDSEQRLLGVVSFRELFTQQGNLRVQEVMVDDFVSVQEDLDQEAVAKIFAQYDLMALPVVDPAGRMRGIVTVDDIVDVVQEEATEDIQKLGGMQALEVPYLQTSFWSMIRKRAGWLSVLFVGETLTATAMGHYEEAIAGAVILAMFVPLIISSGGNSGSQAATLVIRAMALGEVRMKDWWHIVRREVLSGATLGAILAVIAMIQVLVWHGLTGRFGEHYLLIGATVSTSLVGVVLWGTLCGAMLPFLISRFGFDPASASAPFVATLVDVAGLVIYFSVARALLMGTLL